MIQDYALDASLDGHSVGRLVRFTGPGRVGLASVAGSEVGVLTHFYGDGNGGVQHDGGPVTIVAGAALKTGDRITSDGQGRAVSGGTFALVTAGAGQADDPASVLITVLPAPASVAITGPKTSDGKNIFLPNLFPGGVTLYLCGAGDDVDGDLGRGAGALFNLSSEDATPVELEVGFLDIIYLAGGTITWKGAELGDCISLEVYAPKTPGVANDTGTGNANLVFNVWVPANGDGAYDVDLSKTNPVPIPGYDEDGKRTGFWEWSNDALGHGRVTPAASPGNGNCHLVPAPFPLARFVNRMVLLGDGSMNLQIPAIKPKLMWPAWRLKATLFNGGHAGLKAAWVLTLARYATI